MSIRPGFFRVGEDIEISATFSPAEVSDSKVYVKKPNGVITEYPVVPQDGVVAISIKGDVAGTWRVRVQCEEPAFAVFESKFEVVASTVLATIEG